MKNAHSLNPESQWFGRKPVSPQEKTRMVLGVFDSVASRYDIMNDLMSGGIHRLWKDTLIRRIRPTPHLAYLDVAGGTGDIAFRIAKKAGKGADITISDINPSMLEVGKARAIDHGFVGGFKWVEANAESLPFADNSFDVYTISFGLRNVTHIDNALKEAYRVLKPGGRFFAWNSAIWITIFYKNFMIHIPTQLSRRWANMSPEMRRAINIWWKVSAHFPSRKIYANG